MKVGTLAGGIIMMILGVVGYFVAIPYSSDCGSFVGQLGRTFSSGYAQDCQIANLIQIGSAVFGVIGLGLTIGGAVAKGNSNKFRSGGLLHLREEYNVGYEESRPKPKSRRTVKEIEDPITQDNLKNMGILKERLAKGEITKEEYNDLKKEFE